MQTQVFKLSGLTCQACKKIAEKKIKSVAGVNNVNVNLETQEASVESDPQISKEQISMALADTPYKVI